MEYEEDTNSEGESKVSVGQNIFIDFEIIKASNPDKLMKELDTLLALKNNVFVWSKTVPPSVMRNYCRTLVVNLDKEKELTVKIKELRKQKKSYKEISDTTNVPIKFIGFYLTTDPNKVWTIDDWIKDYHQKDSMIYPKVDFIVDPNSKFVDRFQIKGIDGNTLERID